MPATDQSAEPAQTEPAIAEAVGATDPFWDNGPFVVGVMLSGGLVSVCAGELLYDTEAAARAEANRRFKEKPFIAFVPWPVPYMTGRKVYAAALSPVQS